MEKKNWAKKIVALSTGALMLGATLAGALAANDLAAYPAPFVEGGALSDTVIVVGEGAAVADVLGAVDVAAALQAAAVSQEAVEVSSTVAPTVDEGVKIEKSGDKFNYNDRIYGVKPEAVDKNDLDMLKDKTFADSKGTNKDDRDYTQEIQFRSSENVGNFSLYQPGKNDNYPDGRDAGDYLYFKRGQFLYNYTVDFKTAVTTANAADLEGNTIELQGNTYTITSATVTSTNVDKLTLVAGDNTVWLVQDQPYTIGSNTVTVVDVDSGATKCGVNVDGVTKWVDTSSSETFGDLSVTVLDAVAVYTKDYDADTCQLSLGSSEIVLEDGQVVSVAGVELDGSSVAFRDGSWDGFAVTYKLGQETSGLNQADVYLAPNEAWVDPVFGNWKIEFAGVTADYEEMTFDVSSDDATFKFPNYDGKEVVIPFHRDSTLGIILGETTSAPLLKPGENYTGDPVGVQLLYTTSGHEVHVLEISSLTCDGSTNKTSIRDVTYDNTYVAKDEALAVDCHGREVISLGSLGNIDLDMNATHINYTLGNTIGNGSIYTKYEGVVTLDDAASAADGHAQVSYTEKQDVKTPQKVLLNMTWDSTDEEINFGTIKAGTAGTTAMSWVNHVQGDSDTQKAVTEKGTMVTKDNKYKLSATIKAPEKDAYANVFVVPMSATISSGGSSSVKSDSVNPFSVGLAVLDSDAEALDKNMIVVGGPCANTVAAELMGDPADCTEGFEAGKAMVKFFDRSGKAALLVAGFGADDTLGAAYVLADYEDYALSGDEVEVVVTSLDEISVS